MIETWQDMKDRQALERAEAITKHRDNGLTQAEAARVMDMEPRALNNFLRRNQIPWGPSRQGRTTA